MICAIACAIVAVRWLGRHRVLKQVCAKLVDPSEWHEHSIITSTTGVWRGARVWIRLDRRNNYIIRVAVPRWPAAVAVVRRFQGDEIGDPAFDASLRVFGEEAAWRAVLDSATRARLVEVFRDAEGALEARHLELRVEDPRRVETTLDRCAELARTLPEDTGDSLERVFDNTTRESIAAMRESNYRWLVARDWNVLRVYRAASSDADPSIAAWGSKHAPDGVFR
ncbi:MAG TPA: hypothetical protein VGG28_03405 [Kofleriaceae bacterium]